MQVSELQNKVGAFTEGIGFKRVSGGQVQAGAYGASHRGRRALNDAPFCGLAILYADHAVH